MTDDYVPLTDEQVGAIRDDLQWRVPDVLRRILADREHYKRRAEAAEREALRDDMPPMIGDPRGGRGPAGW